MVKRISVCFLVVGMIMGVYLEQVCSQPKVGPLEGEKKELVISDFETEDILWKGGELSDEKVKQGKYSLKWANLPSNPGLRCDSVPDDWTKYGILSFWVYSEVANNQGMQLVISSENPESEGIDYYSAKIVVNWTGWKKLSFPLSSLGVSRNPRGWNQIDNMYFSSNGWGHKPLDDTLFYFDDFKLEKSGAVSTSSVLLNPSFEDKDKDGVPDNWEYSPDGNNQTTFISLASVDGSPAVKIVDNDPKLGVGIGQWIKTTPGHTYSFSANLKGGKIALYLNFYDISKKLIPPENPKSVEGGKDQFLKAMHLVPAPEKAEWCRVWIYSYSGNIAEVFVNKAEFKDFGEQKIKAPEKKKVGIENIEKVQVQKSPSGHPCLLFSKNEVVSILEKTKKYKWAEQAYGNLLKNADKLKEEKIEISDREGQWGGWYICQKCGAGLTTVSPTEHKCRNCGYVWTGYPYDEVIIANQHNRNASNCKTLGVAYALTGDQSYAKKAKEILLGYAEKYEYYKPHDTRGNPSRSGGKLLSQTLDESNWLIPVAQAYDCIYELCTNDEREFIENKLVKPAVEVIKKNNAGESNWQSWHNAALLAAGLVLKDDNLVNETINGHGGFLYQMVNSVGEDGMWYEGSWGYHFYALDALIYFAEMAYHNGIDLYKNNNKLKSLFDAPILFMTPYKSLPSFHDSGGVEMAMKESDRYEIAYTRFGDEKYTLMIPTGRSGLYGLLYGKEEVKKEKVTFLPSADLKDVGFVVLRVNGPNKSYVAMDYGPQGGWHGHLDKLNFVYAPMGKLFAVDPGSIAYGSPLHMSWYQATISHNTILVDETSQSQATGELLYFHSSPLISVATASAGFAYPDVSIQRTLILTDDYLVVVDNVKSNENHTYDWAYHNYGKFVSDLQFKEMDNLSGQGYQHIKNPKTAIIKGDGSILWEVDSSKRLKMWISGGIQTEIIAGDGMGNPANQIVPMVLLRREAKETTYIVVLEPFKKENEKIINVKKEPKNLEITLKNRKDAYSWKDASFTNLDVESIKKVESVLEKIQQETPAEAVDFPVAPVIEGDTRTKSKVELLIEAEDMAGQGEGEIKIREDKIGASKKTFSNWDESGHWLEWKFSIPERGFYTITLKYCTAGSPVRSLIIDNKYPAEHSRNVIFQSTQSDSFSDGWSNKKDDWKLYTFLSSDGKTPFRFYFEPGEHKIRMTNREGGGLNLDYILIRNL